MRGCALAGYGNWEFPKIHGRRTGSSSTRHERPFGSRRSGCYVSLLAVQPSGTSPNRLSRLRPSNLSPLPCFMSLARVPPNHQQRGQAPRGIGGLIFTLVAVAKWSVALSRPVKGSNCCAFPPAKLQPSVVDGSAAGIFHRAEVGGWICAPLSDVSCSWLVRSSHACRPDGKVRNFLPSTWFCCKSIDFWSLAAAPLPGQR